MGDLDQPVAAFLLANKPEVTSVLLDEHATCADWDPADANAGPIKK